MLCTLRPTWRLIVARLPVLAGPSLGRLPAAARCCACCACCSPAALRRQRARRGALLGLLLHLLRCPGRLLSMLGRLLRLGLLLYALRLLRLLLQLVQRSGLRAGLSCTDKQCMPV